MPAATAPLTWAEWEQEIIDDLGLNASSPVAARLPVWRRMFAGKEALSLPLAALYVKRKALDTLIVGYAGKRDFEAAGVSMKDSQVFDHWRTLRKDIDGEIAAMEATLLGGRGGAIGELAKTAPIMVPDGWQGPDPNDTAYVGSPLRVRRFLP